MIEVSETQMASALDRALELLIKVERGQGPLIPVQQWIRRIVRDLTAVEAEQATGKARALMRGARDMAIAIRDGSISERQAIADLVATYPGFDLRSYRLAMAWQLRNLHR